MARRRRKPEPVGVRPWRQITPEGVLLPDRGPLRQRFRTQYIEHSRREWTRTKNPVHV